MSQIPPVPPSAYPGSPVGYGAPMQPQRTSTAAIVSLICGILGCLIITGIVAIITGIVGIRATRNPAVKGRGLAIAGLILGIIGTLGGIGCFASGGAAYFWVQREVAPATSTVNSFAQAAGSGDVDQAMTFVDPNAVSREQVEAITQEMKTLGQPSNITPHRFNLNSNNGVTVLDLGLTLQYPGGVSKNASALLQKQPDGSYKLTSLDLK